MPRQTIEIIVDENGSPQHPVTAAVGSNCMAAAQQPAMLGNLAHANHVAGSNLGAQAQVAHQDAMNRLQQMILAEAVARVQDPGPTMGRSTVDVLSNNELAQTIADLRATVQAFSSRSGTDTP